MKIKRLVPVAIATMAISFSQAVKPAQAAVLGGGNGTATCDKVGSNYFIDCAGWFDGNDKGKQGTGLANLNNLFGGNWSFAGDSDSSNPVVKIEVVEKEGVKSWTAKTTNLSGFGAIAVKAGNSYSLYTVSDLSKFKWSTAGVELVGNGKNVPDLSHISVYLKDKEDDPQSVPEPSLLLSLVGIAGLGTRLKRNKH